jgi:hypothetical protein
MANSITSINSLLVSLKTANSGLLPRLQQLGFNTSLPLGPEQEYTVKTLIHTIDNLSIQFLTITAKRNQFMQRTSFNERKEIESCLNYLHNCLDQTQLELGEFNKEDNQCSEELALSYTNDCGQNISLRLLDAVHYIDLLKPYSRMLEMVTAQERIHALSAVLETLLSKEHAPKTDYEDAELTSEQSGALQLSQYLIRQAL